MCANKSIFDQVQHSSLRDIFTILGQGVSTLNQTYEHRMCHMKLGIAVRFLSEGLLENPGFICDISIAGHGF